MTERDGKLFVESKMRGGGKPLTASRILEKVIIDHTPLDAFVVVDPERDIVAGRPYLTLAVDVHSRAILAWVITFRPPSYWKVAECLRRMNLPKRPPLQDAARYPILVRICGNAAKFTNEGSITLRARINRRSAGAVLSISVEDTGIGIAPERQASICEEVLQADTSIAPRFGGTGLGLSISARLAHLMGGELRLESKPGRGSCFILILPLTPATKQSGSPETDKSARA